LSSDQQHPQVLNLEAIASMAAAARQAAEAANGEVAETRVGRRHGENLTVELTGTRGSMTVY
jgi:hypothetical protein